MIKRLTSFILAIALITTVCRKYEYRRFRSIHGNLVLPSTVHSVNDFI